MKNLGLLLWVSVSLAASFVSVAGCIPEQDKYPNGEHRPPGGIGFTGFDAICGDGVPDPGETCDDGNESSGDGCSSTCQVEACWTCSDGECAPLPINTACSSAQVCDGKGACIACIPIGMACDKCKNCGGATCDEPNDCASEVCASGVCSSAIGSTCTDPVECASNSCAGAGILLLCSACSVDADCVSGACDLTTGQCMAALGQPCDDTIKCAANLQCSAIHICQGVAGTQCSAPSQCVSNYCQFVSLCAACPEGKQCAQGDYCSNGICPLIALPDGAYCVSSADCNSKKCDGFPRKCAVP